MLAKTPLKPSPKSVAKIMGILNITPDSFFDGGHYNTLEKALGRTEQLIKEGASIIDVGGESTRPGAMPVSAQQELDRIMPVLEKIKQSFDAMVCVDTNKPEVMQAAIKAGANMINDVCALTKTNAIDTIKNSTVSICLMHMQGKPRTMQETPTYNNVTQEIFDFLAKRIQACMEAGIDKSRIIVDPGFGFGKTVQHNLTLIKNLNAFQKLGCPILIGASRKSSIGAILNKPVEERLYGSIALHTIALLNGADIIRTHDVGATMDAIKITTAYQVE